MGGGTSVQVEEYKRPTFEAKMLDPEKPLRLNQPAVLKGEAKYYFGLPVTSGQVKWLVRRQPVFPWWWGCGPLLRFARRSGRGPWRESTRSGPAEGLPAMPLGQPQLPTGTITLIGDWINQLSATP